MRRTLLLLVTVVASACAGGGPPAATPTPARDTATPAPGTGTTTSATTVTTSTAANADVMAAAARADSVRDSFSQADVDFMTGMIHHHAQAIVMARMAPTHGASPQLLVLAGRIINAQNDEIWLMQRWLRDRGQPIPDPEHAMHGGMHMDMPGMLTPAQLERLDQARGHEFDRLFVEFMIQHHEGALVMVQELFDTYGAAQGDAIFKLASDIGVDQTTEIDRMHLMLQDMIFETGGTQDQ